MGTAIKKDLPGGGDCELSVETLRVRWSEAEGVVGRAMVEHNQKPVPALIAAQQMANAAMEAYCNAKYGENWRAVLTTPVPAMLEVLKNGWTNKDLS